MTIMLTPTHMEMGQNPGKPLKKPSLLESKQPIENLRKP